MLDCVGCWRGVPHTTALYTGKVFPIGPPAHPQSHGDVTHGPHGEGPALQQPGHGHLLCPAQEGGADALPACRRCDGDELHQALVVLGGKAGQGHVLVGSRPTPVPQGELANRNPTHGARTAETAQQPTLSLSSRT